MEKRELNEKQKQQRRILEQDPIIQEILKLRMQDKAYAKIPEMISEMTGDSWNELKVIRRVEKCIKLGVITKKEIKEKREQEKERFMKEDPIVQQIIKYSVEQKLSIKKIAKQPDISWGTDKIFKCLQKCKELGLIIEKNESLEENPIVKKIIKYKEELGLSNSAIARMEDIPWVTQTVCNYVKKCEEAGWIRPEVVERAKKQRKEEEEKRKMQEDPTFQKVIRYKEEKGLSDHQISTQPDIPWSQPTVSKYLRKYEKWRLKEKKEREDQRQKFSLLKSEIRLIRL